MKAVQQQTKERNQIVPWPHAKPNEPSCANRSPICCVRNSTRRGEAAFRALSSEKEKGCFVVRFAESGDRRICTAKLLKERARALALAGALELRAASTVAFRKDISVSECPSQGMDLTRARSFLSISISHCHHHYYHHSHIH